MGKLIISRANKKRLTKNQEAFNKITAQIEKLRKDIAKKQLHFDNAMDVYSAIHPLRKRKAEELRKVFDILWGVYKSKRLSRSDQRLLKKILQDDMYEIFQLLADKPDEDLKNIFRELEGESYEQVLKREDAEMKEEVKEMFGQMDIDINLDEVEDEAQLAAKLAEARHKLMEQEEQKQHQRQKNKKKTARQVEKQNMQQAAEEVKQKNISTIYRQLAKLFHPDLEQDEARRAEKEMLMKQLTTAYQSKNLHDLLLLELKWIHKETNHLESLTEEKLAVYLQVLREQAKELEQEKYNLFQQPRYYVLIEEFGMTVINAPLKTVEGEKKSLENDIAALKHDAVIFRSDTALIAIKEMLREAKAAMQEPSEEAFLKMLLRMDKM